MEKSKKTRARVSINKEQNEILLDFMKRNKNIAQQKFSSYNDRNCALVSWEILQKQLNRHGPPTKTTKAWKKTWADMKYNTKKKVSKTFQRVAATRKASNAKRMLEDSEVIESTRSNLSTLSEDCQEDSQHSLASVDPAESDCPIQQLDSEELDDIQNFSKDNDPLHDRSDVQDDQDVMDLGNDLLLKTNQEILKTEKARLVIEKRRLAIETQRMELERERLEIERERLAIEKSKILKQYPKIQ
ncbi:hypothetical protein DMENIID0001_082320 [Sergentomyia squamirostris]